MGKLFLFLIHALLLLIVFADHYETLGIEKSATEAEIKKAYRSMALKWHPDKHSEDKDTATAQFQKISEAYEVLSDPEARKRYDLLGDDKSGNHGGWQRDGHPFRHRSPEDIFKEFFGSENPFESMFKHGGGDPFSNNPFASMFGGGGGGGGDPFASMFGGGGGSSFSSFSSSTMMGNGATFTSTTTTIGPDGRRVTKTVSRGSDGRETVTEAVSGDPENTLLGGSAHKGRSKRHVGL